MSTPTIFNNRQLTMILFAILVKRLGGYAVITQEDLNDIAYTRLDETLTDDSVEFTFKEREAAS